MAEYRDIFSDTLDSLHDEKMQILDKLEQLEMSQINTPKTRVLSHIVFAYRIRKYEKEFRDICRRYHKLSSYAKDYYKLVEELG